MVQAPAAILRAIYNGALWRRETWRLFGALLRTWIQGGFPREFSKEEHPAHLHINLLGDFRGQQIGKKLMEHFLQQARSAGVHGVQARVRINNFPAIRFFKNMGFLEVGTQTIILPEGASFQSRVTLIFGMRL